MRRVFNLKFNEVSSVFPSDEASTILGVATRRGATVSVIAGMYDRKMHAAHIDMHATIPGEREDVRQRLLATMLRIPGWVKTLLVEDNSANEEKIWNNVQMHSVSGPSLNWGIACTLYGLVGPKTFQPLGYMRPRAEFQLDGGNHGEPMPANIFAAFPLCDITEPLSPIPRARVLQLIARRFQLRYREPLERAAKPERAAAIERYNERVDACLRRIMMSLPKEVKDLFCLSAAIREGLIEKKYTFLEPEYGGT